MANKAYKPFETTVKSVVSAFHVIVPSQFRAHYRIRTQTIVIRVCLIVHKLLILVAIVLQADRGKNGN